uniref:Uncharacterized protein n=1 Tax=Rhizophora mucronata TaxID=61149 RepID=A0A2P2Q214_RHIMU
MPHGAGKSSLAASHSLPLHARPLDHFTSFIHSYTDVA